MSNVQQSSGKIHISLKQALSLLVPYVKERIMAQIKALALIVLYLIFFQTLILGLPVVEALIIAVGLGLVVMGLAFFMEGLFLGMMPLGEIIGVKLPQKSKLPIILIFAFMLGMGMTFAEPAIGILKAAGSFVKPWDAPLLFLMLNKYSGYLVYAVGVGVGLAVVTGMLRFLYNWSSKPLFFSLTLFLLIFSVWGFFNPNMLYLTGVAWDCGGVTTGPVTVPLVLALGIGICRVVGRADSGASGFGVVSLASLFPIITVLLFGLFCLGSIPKPMTQENLFNAQNREKAASLFNSKEEMAGYAFLNASKKGQLSLFDNNKEKMLSYIRDLKANETQRKAVFGQDPDALERWAATLATAEQGMAVFGNEQALREAAVRFSLAPSTGFDAFDVFKRNFLAAIQAIIPLVLFLMLVLFLILRERLPRLDEVILGVIFGMIGMGMFNIGIELGLAKLGNQVGTKLPSSFQAIPLPEDKKVIQGFDTALVQTAVTTGGETQKFFFTKSGEKYVPMPFQKEGFSAATGQYSFTPTRGPLFGNVKGGWLGIAVVLLFAFIMGYGATLAEPALNALGITVEELTVGTVKKVMIMHSVAFGVGVGMAVGLVKIIWSLPLIWLLLPPYIVLLVVTYFSTEEFTNISWDSGGVTTGPITVPLVIAMGLGISNQIGVVEGFGILALASVYPILTTCCVGLYMNIKKKKAVQDEDRAVEKGAA